MSDALLLVAASGLAREALEAVQAQGRYDVVGVVDDDPTWHGRIIGGAKVLGGSDVVADHPDVQVLVCSGKGAARARIVQRLALPDHRYATVVHPSASIGTSCTVGPGSIVLAGCALTASVTVGEHVTVMPNVTLTHDDDVRSFATLCAGVALGGGVTVGQRAYLGMRAAVRQNLRIGDDATVGMGAVVVTDVPTGQTWVGVPARRSTSRSRVDNPVSNKDAS